MQRVYATNIVEKTVRTEIDKKNRLKGVGWLGWFISKDINLNVPLSGGESLETSRRCNLVETKGYSHRPH